LRNIKKQERVSYKSIDQVIDYPNLMDIQTKFFSNFLMENIANRYNYLQAYETLTFHPQPKRFINSADLSFGHEP